MKFSDDQITKKNIHRIKLNIFTLLIFILPFYHYYILNFKNNHLTNT